MSMGYGANYADVIEEKDVIKMCPKEMQELAEVMDEAGLTDNDLVEYQRGNYETLEEDHPEIAKKFKVLQKAFKKKTGLELHIDEHDSDNHGDCYDEVSGIYWYVDGMYQLTKAGKKMQKYVDRKLFVTYG